MWLQGSKPDTRTIDLELPPRPDVAVSFTGMIEGGYARDASKERSRLLCERVEP